MTEQELLKGLKNNNDQAFGTLYDRFFPSVKYFILRNSGNSHDAEDIFQETSIVLIQNIRRDNFELNSSLKTYFYAIAKNLWLKKLRDTPKTVTMENMGEVFFEPEGLSPQEQVETEKSLGEWVHSLMVKLTGHCLILITKIYFVEKLVPVSYQELGYKNAHTYQNQKYKCLQQLKKAAQSSPMVG